MVPSLFHYVMLFSFTVYKCFVYKVSAAEKKVFDKNFYAKKNQHRSAEKFRFGFIFCAENASDFNSRGGKRKSSDADKRNRKKDINFKECKSYSHCKSIDTCCNREHQHCFEAEGRILVVFRFSRFFYHIDTDYSEKNERNPMVNARYILLKG